MKLSKMDEHILTKSIRLKSERGPLSLFCSVTNTEVVIFTLNRLQGKIDSLITNNDFDEEDLQVLCEVAKNYLGKH